MTFVLRPWQILFLSLAGWVNREQQQIIDYLRTENQVLRELHGRQRLRLNDHQRRRLAAKAQALGRKLLAQIGTLFSPDTLLRWHRELIARKWDYSDRKDQDRKPGRPPTSDDAVQLILQMARDNPTWGYDRLQGALANLGHQVSDQTVGNILKAHGLEPAPKRQPKTTWKTFLQAHWDVLAAIDFTTIEVWTKNGLVTFYLLFVMELATRRVHLAGCTVQPDAPWMEQVARNLTAADDGFLQGKRYLLMDRDGKFSPAFRAILQSAGVEAVLLPPRSPNLNAQLERFNRSLKGECLGQMIFFGEAMLRKAVQEYLAHYHAERNHQGLDNRLIQPGPEVGTATGEAQCRERLGGLLRYYYRASESGPTPKAAA